MRQRKARLTVRETIAQNRATIAGMCALAGKPAPEFHEDLLNPSARGKPPREVFIRPRRKC